LDIAIHLHILHSTGSGKLLALIEASKALAATINCERPDIYDHRARIESHRSLLKAMAGNNPDEANEAAWHHLEAIQELLSERSLGNRLGHHQGYQFLI